MSTTLLDLIQTEIISDCCSAAVYGPSGDWFICMECKEPCGITSEE